VQLDCSLVALQADLLFTHVNTCSVHSLKALPADFEDPFLGPPTKWSGGQEGMQSLECLCGVNVGIHADSIA
jgi:hypothetical protein